MCHCDNNISVEFVSDSLDSVLNDSSSYEQFISKDKIAGSKLFERDRKVNLNPWTVT